VRLTHNARVSFLAFGEVFVCASSNFQFFRSYSATASGGSKIFASADAAVADIKSGSTV
jgi:hypothetical protein